MDGSVDVVSSRVKLVGQLTRGLVGAVCAWNNGNGRLASMIGEGSVREDRQGRETGKAANEKHPRELSG